MIDFLFYKSFISLQNANFIYLFYFLDCVILFMKKEENVCKNHN